MTTLQSEHVPALADAAESRGVKDHAVVPARHWPRTREMLAAARLDYVAAQVRGTDGQPSHWLLYASATLPAPWLRPWTRLDPPLMRRKLCAWLVGRTPEEWAASEGVMLSAIEISGKRA